MTNDCLFCRIINKEIASLIVYEDKNVIAFLDVNPVNLGHTLVLPKKHVDNLLSMDNKTINSVFQAVRDVSRAVMQATKAQGFNVEINNYRVAGQLVDHAHVHIVPRFEGDGLKHWPGKKMPQEQIQQIAGKIRTFLR